MTILTKLKKMMDSKTQPTKIDVGMVRLTVEFLDGEVDYIDVEGDVLETGTGDIGIDAPYISKSIVKNIFREGCYRKNGAIAIPPNQISKILVGDRQSLMKAVE